MNNHTDDGFSVFQPLFDAIAAVPPSGRLLVTIDGPCGAGKTTVAAEAARRFGCTVFHADDFFLRPEQRTEARLAEPGGNLDRERFAAEVLLPLSRGDAVAYRRFDCRTQALLPPETVIPTRVTIAEGSYLSHPYFDDFITVPRLSVYLDLSNDAQRARIRARNGNDAERFFTHWIPMENRYFAHFCVRKRADLVIPIA